MSPRHLSALGWLVTIGAVYAAVQAERTASPLLVAIAVVAALAAYLLQTLALSVSLGRRFDAALAAAREDGAPANDRGR